MKRNFQNAFRLISWDWSTLLLFEILYKLITLKAAVPLFQFLLRESIEIAGVTFISNQSIRLILQNPIVVALLLILLCLFAFYNFIEITAIILYFDYGVKGKSIGVFPLLWEAIKKACSILRPNNLFLLVFILIIMPMTGVILSSGPIRSLHIPEFILEFIENNAYLHIPYLILYLFVLFLSFRWIFSMHEITLRKKMSFYHACRNSVMLINKKWIYTIFMFLVWHALLFAFIAILCAFVLAITVLFVKFTAPPSQAQEIFWYYFRILLEWRVFFVAVCTSVGSLGIISACYYRYQPTKDGTAFVFKKPQIIPTKKDRLFRPARFLGCILLLAIYGSSFLSYHVFYYGEFDIQTSITAHRAVTESTPENTMAGLKEAIASGAKYAEIDVQQTKDGVLVLMHDSNFKRTAGVNKYVWEVDYDEVKTYDAGSWFSPEFAGEPIPTLEEFIAYARGRICLVIELKSTGHERNLAQDAVKLIERLDAASYCIVASMDYPILQTTKLLNPNLTTQLITAVAYGDIYQLEDVDIYSIEASFVTRDLVSILHAMDKQVFVWTVNAEQTMREMAMLCIDSIVTDAPNVARETISSYSGNPLICQIVDLILPLPASP